MRELSGIYKIENKSTKRIYVGSSTKLTQRWKTHRKALRRGIHPNKSLQNAWDKYGENDFDFIIIEKVEDLEILLIKEQKWMDYYRCYERELGYNIRKNATNNSGLKFSKESRLKMSASLKGNKNAVGNRGRIYTEEQLKFAKDRMRGKNNPMFGKHHSEEFKKTLKNRMAGNQFAKGIKHTGETLEKFRKTEEHKEKQRKTMRKLWEFKALIKDLDKQFVVRTDLI